LALGANAYLIIEVNQANRSLITSQAHQRKTIALMNNLKLEAAQLAQLVRTYALTGESRYLLYYYDIVAIRQGQKAAPEHYDPDIYWDNVITRRAEHQPLRETGGISMESRMHSLGFTRQELASFQQVSAKADRSVDALRLRRATEIRQKDAGHLPVNQLIFHFSLLARRRADQCLTTSDCRRFVHL
jgi:hypothetical protein